MARVLVVVGGLLATFIVAVVLYLLFADLSRFRPRVEAAVTDMTGREFLIDGEFEPEVLPTPALVATDVTLANADWGASTPMVSIGRVSVEVSLWSLVFGPIRIKTLELHDVDVLLEENEAGDANWLFTQNVEPEPAADAGETRLPAVIEWASFRDINVVYRTPDRDDFTGVLATLELRTQDDSVAVDGSGQLGPLPFVLKGTSTPSGALGSGGPIDLELEADLDVVEIALEGRADDALTPLEDAELKISVSSDDVARIASLLEWPTLVSGPARIDLTLTSGAGGDPRVAIDATIADATVMRADVSVSRDRIDFEGATGPLDKLAAALRVEGELPALPLELGGSLILAADEIALDPVRLGLGESDFTGSFRTKLDGPPNVVARGESTLIDLTPFLEPAPTGDESAPDAAAEPAAEPAAPPDDASESQWVFGEETLPFDALRSTSVDVELSIAELRRGNSDVRNLKAVLHGDGGTFDLKAAFDAPHGGAASGNIVFAAAGDNADLNIVLEARDLLLNLASGAVEDPTLIPPISLALDARSRGNSPRALASAATGRAVVTMGPGQIENSAIGVASGDILAQLFGALNPFAEEETHMKLECTVLALDVNDGSGVLGTMLAQSDKLQVVGGGTIDFNTEQLEIEFNTKPREGVGITADMFVTPFVKLAGTLASPQVGLNASGALVTGGAAVLTGGISLLLGGMADRATAEQDQCAVALAAVAAPPESLPDPNAAGVN